MIRLRPLTEKDLPFIEKLYRSAKEKGLDLNKNWTELQKAAFFRMQSILQDAHYKKVFPNAVFEIIEYNKKTVGRLYTHESENEITGIDISLLPEFRGRGIGTKILRSLLAKAADKQKIFATQVERNNPAYQLYLRLGFKYTGDNGTYYCLEYRP